jgi:hypothetical protein
MSDTPAFIPGLTLNRRFYWEVVRPLLDQHLPRLNHSAALLGYGSDVLGYDTPISTDHNWGPRLQLFLAPEAFATQRDSLDELLRNHLPPTFAGYSVHFSEPDLADGGTQQARAHEGGSVNHLLSITSIDATFQKYLGIAPTDELSPFDWLALAEQKLLEVTAGELFYDGLETLGAARARFHYYPDDVWKVKLAAAWQRIAEEEAFVGRTGDVGDEVGSWIVAARLARELMRLAFLYARRYTPYSKWLGTAFARLPVANALLPHLRGLALATDWHARESSLVALYTHLAHLHNAAGITSPLDVTTRDYFGRPYQVLFAGRFADAINATIDNADLRQLAPIGAIDQFTDNVAVHSNAHIAAKLKNIYAPAPTEAAAS